jgi:Flp pilus assembly protein TadG
MAIGGSRIRKFLSNERGNALPIMAAAIFPIIASIGAGVDIARAHMTKSKLQEAVDSAALAGRRAMSGDNIETAKPDANAYLGFNFPTHYNGTGTVTTTITKPSTGTVRVAARTTMPSTFMKLFGYDDFDISVVSEATQNFENVDIILVLDTTGSMAQAAGNQSRIEALRSAVNALHAQLADAQTTLRNQGLRMRFGIVPYSNTVNVGKLLRTRSTSYVQTAGLKYYHWRDTNSGSAVNWQFGQRTYDLTGYVGGGNLGNINNHNDGSTRKWAGCIEERTSINTITANDTREGPPLAAYDLDIDLVPTTDNNTKWKPYVHDPKNTFDSRGNQTFNPNQGCPAEATLLKEMNTSDIATAVNALSPDGNTYLDLGMTWGVRLISQNGVFGALNPATFNNRPVQRYIIFMTDGEMNTPRDVCYNRNCSPETQYDHSAAYSAWGIERFDNRVGGTSDGDNDGRHLKRFLMACNEARARRVSVWTIAFGDRGDTDQLKACATNDDQFSYAADSTALIERFVEIGKNIGPLRLSK